MTQPEFLTNEAGRTVALVVRRWLTPSGTLPTSSRDGAPRAAAARIRCSFATGPYNPSCLTCLACASRASRVPCVGQLSAPTAVRSRAYGYMSAGLLGRVLRLRLRRRPEGPVQAAAVARPRGAHRGGGAGRQLKDAKAVPYLVDRLSDCEREVRLFAIVSLERITGQTMGFRDYDCPAKQAEAIDRWRQWLRNPKATSAPAPKESPAP